jgi:cytochrome b561
MRVYRLTWNTTECPPTSRHPRRPLSCLSHPFHLYKFALAWAIILAGIHVIYAESSEFILFPLNYLHPSDRSHQLRIAKALLCRLFK